MIQYLVITEKTQTGFSAYSPDVPGVAATGKTLKQTEKNIFEAIQFHLEGLRLEKEASPKATSEAKYFMFS
jgi:predicted RNase H-like HicB family nuclease